MAHEMLLFNIGGREGHNDTYSGLHCSGTHHDYFCSDGEGDDSVLGGVSHLISIRVRLLTVP